MTTKLTKQEQIDALQAELDELKDSSSDLISKLQSEREQRRKAADEADRWKSIAKSLLAALNAIMDEPETRKSLMNTILGSGLGAAAMFLVRAGGLG